MPSRTDLGTVLTTFEVVVFDSLVARPWAMANDRSGVNDGVTFSATGVAMAKPARNGTKPVTAEAVAS